MWNFHPEKCQENLHEAPELLISEQRCAAGCIFYIYISIFLCLDAGAAEQRVLRFTRKLKKFVYQDS